MEAAFCFLMTFSGEKQKRAPKRSLFCPIGLDRATENQLRREWIGAGILPPRRIKDSQEKGLRGMIGA